MYQFPHHYPLPNSQQAPFRPSGESAHSQIIEQLRRQNQMLKQQLQAVLRMQARSPSPPPSAFPSPTMAPRGNRFMALPPHHAQNQEDEAETAYRNKMSKLKTRKSNRKSFDDSNTAQVSPQASCLAQERPHSRNTQRVPKLPMGEGKMMVISKDKEGKFHRDRSKEQHMATTVRNNSSSQGERPIQQATLNSNDNSFARGARGSHQRVESALPMGNPDRTERIYRQVTPVPSMVHVPQRQQPMRPPHHQLRSEPNGSHGQAHPFPPANSHAVQLPLPRGHVYVERGGEDRGRAVQRKESVADFASEGDSRLSIEMDLRNARSARRLKYDVYMEEEKM